MITLGDSGRIPDDDGGTPLAANENAAAEQPNPDTAEAPAEDLTMLRDCNRDSIAQVFNSMLQEERARITTHLQPTLAALNNIVSIIHSAGLDDVGMHHAGFDQLRDLNLIRQTPGQNSFAILSIHDARFLLRILPDNIVDCYSANLNKPSAQVHNIDDPAFWNPGGKKGTPAYFRYDLSQEADRVDFISTVLEVYASIAAQQELRAYDISGARQDGHHYKKPKAMRPSSP